MPANEGISLEAQRAALEPYCALHGLRLVKICQDVLSGGKDQRPGLQDALKSLEREAEVLVVLKVDRLSSSIRHFCELYERYFKDGAQELVAIRESCSALVDTELHTVPFFRVQGFVLGWAPVSASSDGQGWPGSFRCGHHG